MKITRIIIFNAKNGVIENILLINTCCLWFEHQFP